MQSAEFDKHYAKLNKEQKVAVESLNGPVMVVAGPGTGKTQVLTLRIANILNKTDCLPEQILALTFTESAARSMRERLTQFIGKDAYSVNITTFHGFASSVIMENPDAFVMGSDYTVLSDIERLSIIHKIIDETDLDFLKPSGDPYFYTYYISQSISNLKREGVTFEDYKKITDKNSDLIKNLRDKEKLNTLDLKNLKDLSKQLELKTIYKKFQKELINIKRYDFDDLINFVNNKFLEDALLLKTYQEKFLYILVDEFQDTNSAQYRLLLNLTSHWGSESDIFVVGDDDQSIYRFQGASTENMLSFLTDFKKSTVINLVQNYRSTSNILDSSKNLIQNNTVSIKSKIPQISKNLISNLPSTLNTKINSYRFSNGILESYFITNKIKKLIAKGVSPREIAVIYRNNSDSADLEEGLSKMGILYNIEGGDDCLQTFEVKSFIKLIQVIEKCKNKEEDIDLFTLLNYPQFNFNYLDTLMLSRFASSKKINLVDAINNYTEKDVNIKNFDKYKDFLTQISYFNSVDAKYPLTKTIEIIFNKSGFLNYFLNSSNLVSSLNKINSFYDEVKKLTQSNPEIKIKDLLQILSVYKSNNIKINEVDLDVEQSGVTLTTCHKAKGREYAYVFIYKAVDKKWGNNRNVEYIKLPGGLLTHTTPTKLMLTEEERRLFYVALTRAKSHLYITSSKSYINSYGTTLSDSSMFLLELPKSLVKKVNTKKIENKNFIKLAYKLFLSSIENDRVVLEKERLFLDAILKNYKLSVTALNTYLQCPYKFKLNNVLKTPRSKAPYLVLGTAVHKALEDFYRQLLTQDKVESADYLITKFEEALSREIISELDKALVLKKGKNILRAYYRTYEGRFKKPEFLERVFGYGFGQIILQDGTSLTGKIDRVELIEEKSGDKYVKVIDYKTGKIKTKGEIEGTTKNSSGELKRQLVFYKMLCDMDKTFRYKAKKFELDFIGTGKLEDKPKKYEFEVAIEDVEALKKLIIETMQKIKNMEFLRTTDVSICRNCEYIDHCYPNGIPKIKYMQGELIF